MAVYLYLRSAYDIDLPAKQAMIRLAGFGR